MRAKDQIVQSNEAIVHAKVKPKLSKTIGGQPTAIRCLYDVLRKKVKDI
jgi:hypothetical protein